jgi:hypothetical protein
MHQCTRLLIGHKLNSHNACSGPGYDFAPQEQMGCQVCSHISDREPGRRRVGGRQRKRWVDSRKTEGPPISIRKSQTCLKASTGRPEKGLAPVAGNAGVPITASIAQALPLLTIVTLLPRTGQTVRKGKVSRRGPVWEGTLSRRGDLSLCWH